MIAGDFQLATVSYAGCTPFPAFIKNGRAVALEAFSELDPTTFGGLTNITFDHMFTQWDSVYATLCKLSQDCNDKLSPWWESQAQPLEHFTIHAPYTPRQVFCTVGNYIGGAIEAGLDNQTSSEADTRAAVAERQKHGAPYVCTKLPSAIIGPTDPIELNPYAEKADWEVELGVIIGRGGQFIDAANANEHIAAYTVVNDITARDYVNREDVPGMGTDWLRAKCSPGYLPMGPYIVPAPFVPSQTDVELKLALNGEVMQNERVSDMIFSIPEQIAYISRYIRLQPGDLICSGSPAGFGLHYNRFLSDGDVVEASAAGLGTQRNPVIAATTNET